ncbi:Uncharacterised protein [Mycobacteroides abscessus subsp. abscessus]|nr:Uncharacterised protein [Mycobacteroides abscessus subsp. abscessus]
MKMCRWSKAATNRRLAECNMPLPNTSPEQSPMPATVTASVSTSIPISVR